MAKPVFLVSLPRSGSTLMQKVLATHPDIASTAEPWLLLPFWAMRQPDAARSVYAHGTAANALVDFIEHIPNGESVFEKAAASYAMTLYEAAAGGKKCFLDKTPRYYLMLPELARMFPQGIFVILVRNPLAVLASISDTFHKKRFRFLGYGIDWIEGHKRIASFIRQTTATHVVVRYEDFVANPREHIQRVCGAIGVPYCAEMVDGYTGTELSGRMGDPIGIHRYKKVSVASVEKWKKQFETTYKRRVVHKVLDKVAGEDFQTLGYPIEDLHTSLEESPAKKCIDIASRFDRAGDLLATVMDYRYVQARWRARISGRPFASGFARYVL